MPPWPLERPLHVDPRRFAKNAGKPLADAHGSARSHDRKGVVARKSTTSHRRRPGFRLLASCFFFTASLQSNPEAHHMRVPGNSDVLSRRGFSALLTADPAGGRPGADPAARAPP